jgi:hypothetical protein
MNHVVMFSGGIGSWTTASRVRGFMAPVDTLILLCANTNTEADDWEGCVKAYAEDVSGVLVMLDNDGRDIWDVFREQKFIGNTRADICSRILKREPMRKWLEESCDPASTVVYLGFDWTEAHRLERARPHWVPWTIAAPLCDPPYRQKSELIALAESRGLPIPALYRSGFSHNNCGGACVKAGQAQWEKLLRTDPDTYRHHENQEDLFRTEHDKDVSILRDRTRGTLTPLTLRRFRERLETQPALFDDTDWGACSCMTPEEP